MGIHSEIKIRIRKYRFFRLKLRKGKVVCWVINVSINKRYNLRDKLDRIGVILVLINNINIITNIMKNVDSYLDSLLSEFTNPKTLNKAK
jgi:hypothetical protein